MTKDLIIEKLVDIAGRELGTREGTIENTGARIEEYQGATWLHPGPWKWCAAFTCWLMREWLEDDQVRFTLAGIFSRPNFSLSQAEKVRCRDASAFGWEKWAKRLNIAVLPETELARKGDFVVFDFSHIGLVVENQPDRHADIKTIEGNTHGKDSASGNSGDGVWKKTRAPSLVKSYIRIIT